MILSETLWKLLPVFTRFIQNDTSACVHDDAVVAVISKSLPKLNSMMLAVNTRNYFTDLGIKKIELIYSFFAV